MQQLSIYNVEFPIHLSAKTIVRRLSATVMCLTLAGVQGREQLSHFRETLIF